MPSLSEVTPSSSAISDFLAALASTEFTGEVRDDYSSRLLAATDNSIYQLLPRAVIFPRSRADIVAVFTLAQRPEFASLTFIPRGGGTGTNGQSLGTGIVLDCSKYMRDICEINIVERWVRVQPGVILDQLNEALKPHGLCFAPNVAPSSRATIGGMINTDACGKGSRVYGRTSDHVLALEWVMVDGTAGYSAPIDMTELELALLSDGNVSRQFGATEHIYRTINDIVATHQDLIQSQFPKMPRFLTGYNLTKVVEGKKHDGEDAASEDRIFDLNRILAGSEGTLAVVTEATLRLTPLPQTTELIVMQYDSFDAALSHSQTLLETNPIAIETIDETILTLARRDEIYLKVKAAVGNAQAINLVEFASDDASALKGRIDQLCEPLTERRCGVIGWYVAKNEQERTDLWALRKRGVGLLGNQPGPRQPIAFMEDTAVPPDRLLDYVSALQKILDDYDLDYAMFGHVDVGCLHVRPALNMQLEQDASLVREISDRVAQLVRSHGGVMWAEHGRGFRCEYTPLFFGEVLYEALREIKAAFDPHNRLNPGKIVTAAGTDMQPVTLEAPLKGEFDRQVPAEHQADYVEAFRCNGNGACFNVSDRTIICPSYKGSSDRVHSPKGRATLLREWLRLEATNQSTATFDREVYESMQGCLGCLACVSQCPIHVKIPRMRGQFLAAFAKKYGRSRRDFLYRHLELLVNVQRQLPQMSNLITQQSWMTWLIERMFNVTQLPRLSPQSVTKSLRQRGISQPSFEEWIRGKRDAERDGDTSLSEDRRVILLSDLFTTAYDASLVLAVYDLLTQLGFDVWLSPPLLSGLPLRRAGWIEKFEQSMASVAAQLATFQTANVPLVGIEPSVVTSYREVLGNRAPSLDIYLPQTFLLAQVKDYPVKPRTVPAADYVLFAHCHERVQAAAEVAHWPALFERFGLSLKVEVVGCCGMAGLYGYEVEQEVRSRSIFDHSWQPRLAALPNVNERALATGLSCRLQVERFNHWRPKHPLEALRNEVIPGLRPTIKNRG